MHENWLIKYARTISIPFVNFLSMITNLVTDVWHPCSDWCLTPSICCLDIQWMMSWHPVTNVWHQGNDVLTSSKWCLSSSEWCLDTQCQMSWHPVNDFLSSSEWCLDIQWIKSWHPLNDVLTPSEWCLDTQWRCLDILWTKSWHPVNDVLTSSEWYLDTQEITSWHPVNDVWMSSNSFVDTYCCFTWLSINYAPPLAGATFCYPRPEIQRLLLWHPCMDIYFDTQWPLLWHPVTSVTPSDSCADSSFDPLGVIQGPQPPMGGRYYHSGCATPSHCNRGAMGDGPFSPNVLLYLIPITLLTSMITTTWIK